ncbi:MAG TPA: divalent metal cation transporter, partial [Candidatus Baltobacteraceae bacterium]|nr:divalent metal cation transporter [Candidatus Baltobacteraceae bacterium]
TLVPRVQWNERWLVTLLGVLGTTVTPYLFFWQASQYVEEERELGRPTVAQRRGATAAEIADMHEDVNSGMIYSNAMTFFIIVTTAATLGVHHLPIDTAQEAAVALRPLAGDAAALLFMFGIVGTGLLAIPVLAGSSAYAVAELAGAPSTLSAKIAGAPLFYAVLGTGLVGGLIMALLGLDAMKMLYYSAVFNGIAVVPLIYFVVRMASTARVLGGWVSSTLARAVGWVGFWFMLLAALAIPAALW